MSVLDFVRKEDPRFNEVPDDQLVEFIIREEPEFLADRGFRKQARSLFGRQQTEAESPAALREALSEEVNPLVGTAIGRAATRGFGQMVEGVSGAFDAANSMRRTLGLGTDPTMMGSSALGRAAVEGALQIPAEGPGSFAESQSPSEAAAFLIERGVGEQLPNLTVSAMTAGAGTLAGLSTKAASILGAITTTFPVELGSAYDEILKITGKESPVVATGVGAINAFLETFGDSKLIERALGGDQIVGRSVSAILKSLAARTGKQAGREAGVEAAQELTTALAPMLEGAPAPSNLLERTGTAALLGAAGAGAFSGGVDTSQLALDTAQSLVPTATDRERWAKLAQLDPGAQEMRYTPADVAQPGLSFIQQPDLGQGAPPVPSSQLPTTENIPSSITPGELTSLPEFAMERRRDLVVRPANLEPIPELPQVIPMDTSLGVQAAVARQQLKQERAAQERARQTREQRVANELFDRLDAERRQSLAEAQAAEAEGRPDVAILKFSQGLARRIDLLMNRRPAPEVQTDQGLNEAVQPTIAPSPVDMLLARQLAPIPETDQGMTDAVAPAGPSPVDTFLGQAVATSGPAVGVVAPAASPSAPTPAPAREEQLNRRQSGQTFTIKMTPERQAAIEAMGNVSEEEMVQVQKVDSNGLPTGTPESNEGALMQQFLHANSIIRSLAARQGVVLDAESEANLERRYQEQALNQYVRANKQGMGFNQLFNRAQAFRAALKDTSRMANTAGTLRGRVESTEMETDSGTIVRSEVEQAASEANAELTPQERREQELLDFLDRYPERAKKDAAVRIISQTLGFPAQQSTPQMARWERNAAFRAEVEAFARSIDLDRDSLAAVVRSPMSVADVQAEVLRLLPNAQVQVVDQPQLVNEDGIPIRGQYRPDQSQPFLLNAAYLGSPADVKAALYEELVHGVWADPEVQAEWAAVKASLTAEDLQEVANYPVAEREEEAAVRRVLQSEGQPGGWFDRMIRAITSAIQRLFGVVDPQVAGRRILRRALQQRSAGGPRRNSLAQGLWKNLREVRADEQDAGDPVAIRGSAAAQGTVIPQAIFGRIKGLGTTGEQLVASRILRPVVEASAMGHDLVSEFSAIGPSGIPLSSGLTIAPANARDIAAEAVLKQSLRFQQLREKARKSAVSAESQLEEAIARIPERAIAQNSADLYRGMSDQLAGDYRTYLTNEMLTLKRGAYDPEIAAEIGQAAMRVTEDYKGIGNAVAQALRQIAREIPPSALTTAESARAWIEQRLNDPAQPRLMSDEARDWLFQPIGRRLSPIARDSRIHIRLAAVQELAKDGQAAKDALLAFQKAFAPSGRKVNPLAFARRWAALREKYAEQMATVREIDRTIARLEDLLEGSEIAEGILDQLLADPQYQSSVDEAVNHLQAGTNIRQYEVGSNGQYTGRVLYMNPLTQEAVAIDLQPDPGKERQNVDALGKLQKDVQAWMATTDDRTTRAAWDKELDWIQTFAFGVSPGLFTGHLIGGYKIPSLFQTQPFGRQLWQGRMDVRGPAYQRIGNRVVQGAHQAALIYGQVDRELRQITEEFDRRIKETAVKAVASHGWTTDRRTLMEEWVPRVLEPLISQAQNPTSKPFAVGDYIAPDLQVTKEDLAAAQALKDRDNRMFDVLQKAGEDGAIPLLYFNPLQTSEEFAGRPLNRRAVDYGLKMPRRPLSRQNERGRTFTTEWIQAPDGPARQKLLAQEFDWVLMGNGLIGNTDKEFDPNIRDEDAQLFARIRQLQRTNALPFTDLPSLVEWAGEQLATATVDEATAAADFEIRLMGYVDTFVRNFNQALDLVPQNARRLFERLAVPRGTIDSVGVGESPFLTPRGRLVAPPSFYRYTAVDDQSWGALMAGVRTVLTLQEVEAVNAAKAAIDREVERFEDRRNGLIVQLQKKLREDGAPRVGPFAARRRIARQSKTQAEKGQIMYDYLTLKDHQRTITVLLSDLQRLGREHTILPEDNEAINFIRGTRQTITSALLQSLVSVANNIFGGTVANTLYRRALGNWNFVSTPVEMLGQSAKYATGAILSKMRKIPGIDPAVNALLATPGFRKVVELLVEQQLAWEQQRAKAVAARTVDPQSAVDRAAVARLFPETYGRLTDQDPGVFVHFINSLTALIPGLSRVMETSKSVFPGAFDRAINQVTTSLAADWAEQITDVGDEAWAARDTGVPGWDDLSNPMNRFTAGDLKLPGETQLKFWRDMLAPVGSLEALTLEHYRRKKAGTNLPLLTDAQAAQVAQEVGRMTNMSDATATPTMFQGRGWSGEMRKTFFMLLRYPVNFAAVQENLAGKTYGDNDTPAKRWRLLSASVAALLAVLLTSLGSEFGQEARELITGDPRTRQSIATILDDPTLGDLGKYAGISVSSILPFWGERIAQLFGGTSNKPLLDVTSMFAPAGLLADLEQAVIKTAQTGDMTYPMIDLTRRYIPLSGIVLNRLLPGEADLKEASRGLRLAAPSEIELRPQSGVGTTTRQTPQTPLIRTAIDKAMSGDSEGSRAALDQAIALQVESGKTPSEARSSVSAAFQARDPERTTFGRPLTADERRRVLARMSGGQRAAYQSSRKVFDRPLLKTAGRRRTRKKGRSRARARPNRVS